MKKILTVLVLIISLFALIGCNKTPKNKVTIGFMSSLGALPYIYALEEGFYNQANIEVEIKIFRNANDRDAALIGNHVDGINTDFVMLANNLENDLDLVVTATTEDGFYLVANETYGNNLTDIKSTDNATVGTFENGVLHYFVSKIATDNEIEYTRQGIPLVPARAAALIAEEIDMAMLPEPFASEIPGGKKIWSNLDSNEFVTCLAFKREYAEKNKELLKQFFDATDAAINQLKTASYDNYKGYLLKHNLLTSSNVDIIELEQYDNLVLPNKNTFDNVINWMYELNIITRKYNLDDIIFDWKK